VDRDTEVTLEIRGMYDTGTNVLLQTLEETNPLRGNVSPMWPSMHKHCPPHFLNEVKRDYSQQKKHWPGQTPRGSLKPNSVVDVFIVRHPLAWISGIHKAPYGLKCKNHDGEEKDTECTLGMDVSSCELGRKRRPDDDMPAQVFHEPFDRITDVWETYYGASGYQSLTGNWIVVRYEDLLVDTKKEVGEIEKAIAKMRGERYHPPPRRSTVLARQPSLPSKSHGAARSFDDAQEFNLNEGWQQLFAPGDVARYCSWLNATLLKQYNYECEEAPLNSN